MQLQIANQVEDHEYFQNSLQVANQVTYLIQFADHRSKKTQCSLCKIQDSDCRPTLQAEQNTSNKQIADLLAKQTATTIQKGFLTQILPHRGVYNRWNGMEHWNSGTVE